MQQMMGNFRTMFLFRGFAAIIFGVLTLVWPKLSLAILVLLFGVFAVISGITAVATAVRNREEQGWVFLLFEGILGIAAPGAFVALVRFFQMPPVIYPAAVIRVAFGVVLVRAAPRSVGFLIPGGGAEVVVEGFLDRVAGAKAARKIRNHHAERCLLRSCLDCNCEFHFKPACLSIFSTKPVPKSFFGWGTDR